MAIWLLLTAVLSTSLVTSVGSQCGSSDALNARVPENSPVGTLVLDLTGPNPPNTPVSAILDDPNYGCYFSGNTNGIYMAKVFDLEMPTSCAPGGGTISGAGNPIVSTINCPSSVRPLVLTITPVDEFDPYFLHSVYNFSVSESDPPGTAIFTFKGQVADNDFGSSSTSYSFAIVNDSTASNVFTTTFNGEGITAGVLRIQQPLDFDAGPEHRNYMLNLSSTDTFGKMAFTRIQISIRDVDDLSLRFSQDIYRLSFTENETSLINVSIPTVPPLYASDLDIGINQTVGYAIQSGSLLAGRTYLAINSSTGEFQVVDLIDREQLVSNELLVQVKAYQTDKPGTRIALATVIVTVLDKNDNPPVVSPASVTTSIAENSAVGTYVTRLSVSDKDLNSSAEFVIVDPSGAFQIDANSGVVTVLNASLLDRETFASFSFQVFARELGPSAQFVSNNVSVTVNLIDANDNSPQFVQQSFVFNVSETTPNGTLLGYLNASDLDAGPNGLVKLSLSFASDNGLSVMYIDPDTGALRLRAELTSNPVFISAYQLVVTATDQSVVVKDRRSSLALVRVNVFSASVSPPIFAPSYFVARVTEAAPVGTSVLRLTATHKYPGTVLNYSLVNTTGSEKFSVVTQSNEGLVLIAEALDRETVDFYNLTAVVSYGSLNATAPVYITVLDSNDQTPKFIRPSFNFNIAENLVPPKFLGRAVATDADQAETANSAIQYSLLGAQAEVYFSVNATTGELFTQAILDREASPTGFSFAVMARDGGLPALSSTAVVTVLIEDVNDNPPEFESSTTANLVSLVEKGNYADFLQMRFTDADVGSNRDSKFELVPPSDLSGAFTINATSGQLSSTVALTRSLFSNSTVHNITVLVYNTQPMVNYSGLNRTFIVSVRLSDANDNRPVFVQRLFSETVPEDFLVGREIISAKANDLDATAPYSTIVYSITGGNSLGTFRLDSGTGSLTLWQSLNYDPPDRNRNFSLQIIAYNPTREAGGFFLNDTAEIQITVTDVNDNAPMFSQNQYNFSIMENLTINSEISSSIRATDNDSTPATTAAIFYELRPSGGPFAIDNTTGNFRLVSSVSRDDGGPAVYSLQAVAINLAASPQLSAIVTLTVYVDNVNNNWPAFSASVYNFSVSENAPLRTAVGSLTVNDRDGDAVTLSVLTAGSPFLVESTSLLTNARIDRENLTTNPIVIVVQASDGLHRTNATVRITVLDLNDNAPQFSPAVSQLDVSVKEAANNGTLVVKLNATDVDLGPNGDVVYSILTADSPFLINTTTGEVLVANGNLLDYQKQTDIPILVVARDQGDSVQSTMLTLRVKLIDTNDKPVVFNPRVYTATVQENQNHVLLVTRLYTADPDTVPSGFNFSLPAAADAAFVYIDNATMTRSVSLLLNKSLDREQRSFYSVMVSVTDGIFSDSALVNITISDENDNPPIFQKMAYTFFADEQAPNGQVVGNVKATDADIGVNAQLNYFLSGKQDKFSVDYATGDISIRASLNGTAGTAYVLIVTARDQGAPSLSGTATVTVYANQTNSNAPIFSPSVYTVSVSESAPNNTVLATVTATDADFPSPNGIITYSLQESNATSGLFSIDSLTGVVRLIGHLDYEKVTSYTVIVLAIDRAAAPRTATAQLLVQVLNADDTPPRFVPDSYFFYAPQNASVGFEIGSVIAVDPDFPSASPQPVTYSAASVSNFQVNWRTGALNVSSGLTIGNFSFSITCTDASNMSGNAIVTVSVIPSDVYFASVPQFLSTSLVASVLENQTVDTFVIDVNATVNGGAADVSVSYRLDSGETFFSVNSTGVVLATPRTLDRELSPEITVIVVAANSADAKFSSSSPIRILLLDINDNAPRFAFSSGEVIVYENATVGSTVCDLRATDADTSSTNLTYTIVEDNSAGKFRLQDHETALNTSKLILNSFVDYEALHAFGYAYSLKIQVSDGSFSSNYSLTVRVGNVNDNPPVFSASTYRFSIPEHSDSGTLIGRVIATDPDAEDQGKLVYSITGTTNFTINATSGEISSLTVFDRRFASQFSFNVVCNDTAGNGGQASVIVDITDVNNFTPNMTNLPANWTVTENATSLLHNFSINVIDSDFGENANVSLSIVSGDLTSSFAINGSRVDVIRALDREAPGLTLDSSGNGVVSLLIRAADKGVPSRSSTATLTVLLQDVNDSPPRFSIPAGRVFQQAESLPVGSTIVTFDMLDADLPASNNFTFSISSDSNPNGTFAFRGSDLVLSKALNRVATPSHNLTISCFDGVFLVSTFVTVTVLDSNNFSPVFSSAVYTFNVTENDNVNETGQFVGVVTAVDRDTGPNGQVTYSVASPSNLRHLLTISQNGTVTLNGTLDRETNTKQIFLITATDKGASPRFGSAELHLNIIDVNDNAPQFTATHYVGTVAEGSTDGTVVSFTPPVQVTDRDLGNNAYVEFHLAGSAAGQFQIDATSGRIEVASGATLDRESQPSITFAIVAANTRGQPAGLNQTVNVTVQLNDVNDNSPIFSNSTAYSFSVLENATTATRIGRVQATDADIGENAALMYAIVGGSEGRFEILVSSGDIRLLSSLDREVKYFYQLNVTATDRGFEPRQSYVLVNVTVLDVNDVVPNFGIAPSDVISFDVPEEQPPQSIGRINASDTDLDDNSRLTYYLNDSTVPFNITSDGIIQSTSRLDRESVPSYRFVVYARDAGFPSLTGSATVAVQLTDINDNSPEFAQSIYSVATLEKAPVGPLLIVSARDGDIGANANLTYQLQGSGSEYFSVHPITGLIEIANSITISQLLSRGLITSNTTSPNETVYSPLLLQLLAFDNPLSTSSRRTGTAQLRIDVSQASDRLPTFTQASYTFSVAENSLAGTSVGTVSASVVGTSTVVKYRLNEENSLFQIDELTGNITVRNGALLDRENGSLSSLLTPTVLAFTESVPLRQSYGAVRVILTDVNDNKPVFSQPTGYSFAVAEEQTVPVRIGAVAATDADAEVNALVTYSIVSGNSAGIFAVNDLTGVLTAVKRIDREAAAVYSFQVAAIDNGNPTRLSSSVSVTVSLADANDNAPVLSVGNNANFNVTEGLAAGYLVAAVTATDVDAGLNGNVNFRLVQTDVPPMFYIESNGNGSVSLFTLGPLSFASKRFYQLTLWAFDLGVPAQTSSANITVSVIRLDTNRPRFTSSLFTTSVADNLPPNTEIFDLAAGTREFTYTITDGDLNDAFFISRLGRISVTKLLAPLTPRPDVYTLQISARDELNNTASTILQVWLTVPNTAVFNTTNVTLSWREGRASGRELIYDFATLDEQLGRTVQYVIESCSPIGCNSLFTIDQATGQFYLSGDLDREAVTAYTFVIRANLPGSGGSPSGRRRRAAIAPPTRDTSSLTLTVTDVNDNPPVFNVSSPFRIGILINSPVNTFVYAASATDRDSSAVLTYSLTNQTEQFYINLNSAEIFTRATFSSSAAQFVGVQVTDGVYDTAMVIEVNLLTVSNSLILTAGITPDVFSRHQSLIKTNLSGLLGVDFRVAQVTSAVSGSGDSVRVDPAKTDANIYAFNPKTGSLISRDELRQILEAKRAQIAAFFAQLGATGYEGVRSPVLTSGGGGDGSSTSGGLAAAEVGLIVMACLILVACIVAVILLLCWLSKRFKRRWRHLEGEESAAARNGRQYSSSPGQERLQLRRKLSVPGETNGEAPVGAELASTPAPTPLAAMQLVSNPSYRRNPRGRHPPSQFGSASAVASAAAAASASTVDNAPPDSPRRSFAYSYSDNISGLSLSRIMFVPASYNSLSVSLGLNGEEQAVDEDGNPIIVVNNADSAVHEDAWLAAATNRLEPVPVNRQPPEDQVPEGGSHEIHI